MRPYLVYPPKALRRIYSELLWAGPKKTPKTIYLTFDDGPTESVTFWVLDLLLKYQIKATFFLIGKNIEEYPEIYARILKEGHRVGNHTHNHLKGWKHSTEAYLENIARTEALLPQKTEKLFRPPYGRIKKSQIRALLDLNYKIIMWSALSADWDSDNSPEQCVENCLNHTENGRILVFHDSKKAQKNLMGSLETVLKNLLEQGYEFGLL